MARTLKASSPPPRRESDPPQTASGPRERLVDPGAAIYAALHSAITQCQRVRVVVRGDAVAGRPARVVEGVACVARPTLDGRARVAILLGHDVELVLRVDRIAMVLPC